MDTPPLEQLPDRTRPAHFPVCENFNRSVIIFVTVCTKDRQPLLASDVAHEAIVNAWRGARTFMVGRYVIMPDHVHFFCSPACLPVEPLARWMSFWKSISARGWSVRDVKVWQRDYWDTQLRRGQSYSGKWEYVRANRVRAGLVAKAEDWPFQGELNKLMWHD